MGIALFTASRLFSPLQALVGWLVPLASQATCARRNVAARQVPDVDHSEPHSRAAQAQQRMAARNCAAPAVSAVRRPLRVLRVVESNAAPASAGRMLISGRMADVCAELDRLAAKEAAQHCA
ncbi:MAG TPA: hypothetical protein VLJ57_20240 [Burkholderiaceae bacterium]|nr:hypothetical protein [Burkholderiaceae bacterium]